MAAKYACQSICGCEQTMCLQTREKCIYIYAIIIKIYVRYGSFASSPVLHLPCPHLSSTCPVLTCTHLHLSPTCLPVVLSSPGRPSHSCPVLHLPCPHPSCSCPVPTTTSPPPVLHLSCPHLASPDIAALPWVLKVGQQLLLHLTQLGGTASSRSR